MRFLLTVLLAFNLVHPLLAHADDDSIVGDDAPKTAEDFQAVGKAEKSSKKKDLDDTEDIISSPELIDAKKVSNADKKSDELELESDVEDMEKFGDDASREQAKRETSRLQHEQNQLEVQVRTIQKQNMKSKEKTAKLQDLYNRKAKLAIEMRKQAAKTEIEKRRDEKVVSQWQSRLKNKETDVVHAVEKRKAVEQRVGQLRHEQLSLKSRLARAERNLRIAQERQRRAHDRALRMRADNRALARRVAKTERAAHRTSMVR